MNKKIVPLLLFFVLSVPGVINSQSLKYWIKFKDKTGTPYSVSSPGSFLTQKSIDRRKMYNIAVNATDLPVTPSYITQVENIPNVHVVYASKWLNGLVAEITNDPAALNKILLLPFVNTTQKVNRYRLNIPEPYEIQSGGDQSGFRAARSGVNFKYGGSEGQIKQLQVDCLHDQGYRGQGMTIAVMDVGFNSVDAVNVFDSLRNNGGILGTRDFVEGGTNAYRGGSHGTMVLSCMAANKPDTAMGSAPLAQYWLLRTEEGGRETLTEEYNWIRAAEFADSVGADILTTSLGYTTFDDPAQNHTESSLDGRTAPMSIAANLAARKGMFVLNAAGNEGENPNWKFISVPGDADSICTVGAVNAQGVIGAFSSRGPTYDKRIKPDLVARGEGCWVCEASGVCFPGNGTSFSTPVLAGAVACYWQAQRKSNNIKILQNLRASANNATSPNNNYGWGIPNTCVNSSQKTIFIEGTAFLSGKTDHKGIKVIFTAVSGSAVNDTAITAADGTYSVSAIEGTYNVTFLKGGYYDKVYEPKINILISGGNTLKSVTLSPIPLPDLDFDFTAFSDPLTSVIAINLVRTNYNNISVEVFDMLGHVIFSNVINNTETTINLNAFVAADGVYLVKVRTSKGTKTKKVLKR